MAERKRRWPGLAVAAVIIAALASVIWINTQPYSPQSARRLYQRHQAAYDAVGEALLRAGEGRYWGSRPEDFPEGISRELDEVLRAGRWTAGAVWYTEIGIHDTPAVLFHLYGEEFPSGDGGNAWRYQYLAYIPEAGGLAFFNEHTEQAVPLAEGWYLYTEVVL